MTNEQPISYTTEEIAELLKVSKLTVYDLIKKGEIEAYRVGRQMRIDQVDFEAYKERMKSGGASRPETAKREEETPRMMLKPARPAIISGQDLSLDLLASAMEKRVPGFRPLRSYTGSLNSLVAMYSGEADLVSMHLFDGDTGTYNIPYVKRILAGRQFIVMNLLSRKAGLYVQKGNPKKIREWSDFRRPGLTMVNREQGSGARILFEEMMRLEGIRATDLKGHADEEMNHIAVAGKIAAGLADVGIGIEKAAQMTGAEFIPLIDEQYDLVMQKTADNESQRELVLDILRSSGFQQELASLKGYDLTKTGTVLYETN